METARGRWFLAEYTRRNRNSDTQLVLDAVNRLESTLSKPAQSQSGVADIRLDLIDMAEAISRTRTEIKSLQNEEEADRFLDATEELDAVVGATEKATNEILTSAEKVQELVWTIMEGGQASEECAKIDELIIDIYTGCSFQDITGQRIQKVVEALRYVESRVNAMIDIWNLRGDADAPADKPAGDDARPDAHLLNGPAKPGEEVDQGSIDDVFDSYEPELVDPEPNTVDWQAPSIVNADDASRVECDDSDLAFASIDSDDEDVDVAAQAEADLEAAADDEADEEMRERLAGGYRLSQVQALAACS
ncbi:hypothetical protein ACKTEK_09865 [Tepidamorphus sp. 3E244]|uniref:hypothetical protein n=1 Tax=Tepidamorphus sp. 3E244 TaxID=3385498 RepID=UPI0038FC81E2